MELSNRRPVIDFTSYITERTANFTGREWVFQAINDWFANPDGSRFFLLRGEPGSGKTAISARLSQFAEGTVSPPDGLAHLLPNFLSAFHFCSARDSRWINPRVFAESLALQLAERYPVYAKALAEKSGDRSIRIEVQQRYEQGQAIGVLIKKLDVSGVSPEDAFNRVVREPLEELLSNEFDAQVIILVDALDEALSSTITPTIVSLLSQTDNLPSRVRFILTSRLEMDVLRPLRRSHPKELTLTSGQGLTQSLQDVQLYTQFALDRNAALENKLAPGLSRQALITAIQQKSEGNFLYVRYLLNMLQEQQEQITLAQLDTLPTGLDGIYLEFLERLVTSDTQSWENKYAPILGALAVAQIPLTEAQLSNLINQPELSMTLKRLHQLLDLDESLPLSQRTYALYHRSFIDFLLDKDRSEEYGRDEKREHLQLAHWCEKDNLSLIWEDVKYSPGEQGRRMYARKYYVTHLYLSQEWQQPHKQHLFEVLDSVQYGQAKMHDDPSGRSYAQDMDLGRQAAAWKGWTREQAIELLPRLWQYTLLRVSLTSRADRYPSVVFGLLVILKRKQEAIELAELVTDPIRKISALVQIAEKLREQSDQETEWLGVLMRAREVVWMIQGSYEQAKALRELATVLTQAQQWERAEAMIDRIPETSERNEALRKLATVLTQAQQWERAEAMIDRILEISERNEALRELARALIQAQQWERTEALISRIPEGYSREQEIALSELATALAQAQQWERTEALINRIPQGYNEREKALMELAIALVQAQQWKRADAIIGRSWSVSVLREFAKALIQAQQWKRVEAVIGKIQAFNYGEGVVEYQALERARIRAQVLQAQQWKRIEAVIPKIPGDYSDMRAQALNELATALIQAQQWERAEAAIDRVIEGYSYEQEMGLSGLERGSGGGVQQRHWAGAFIGKIRRGNALRKLATALIEAQQWERAEAMISKIPHGYSREREEALREFAKALIQAQQWEQAETVIGKIHESDTLRESATALIQAQQWKQAETVIGRIQNSHNLGITLSELAVALALTQQWEQLEAVIGKLWPAGSLDRLVINVGAVGESEQLLQLLQLSWLFAKTRGEAFQIFSLAIWFISEYPEFGRAFYQAYTWVETFLP